MLRRYITHPIELETPSGLLFYNEDNNESYNRFSELANQRNIFEPETNFTLLLDLTSRRYDIIFVDIRGVCLISYHSNLETGWSNALTCGFTSQSYLEYDGNLDEMWIYGFTRNFLLYPIHLSKTSICMSIDFTL